jgi:hypothetical protein
LKEEELKERHILVLEELAIIFWQYTIIIEELVDQVVYSTAIREAIYIIVLDIQDILGQFVNNYQAIISNYWFTISLKLT